MISAVKAVRSSGGLLVRRLSKKHFSTVSEAVEDAAAKFRASAVPEPEVSARHLVARVVGAAGPAELARRSGEDFPSAGRAELETMVNCRLARMPVQYIVREWDFRRLEGIAVRPPVFIPRPETEELVGLVLPRLRKGDRVLEVGCGSGAVSLSLLAEGPDGLAVTAADRSQAACVLAAENASRFGMSDRLNVSRARLTAEGSFDPPLPADDTTTPFDIVVSNPPYVPRRDIADLEPEVSAYEDLRALDGGADGLDVVRAILKFCSSGRNLKPGGRLFLELAPSHRTALPEALETMGLSASMELEAFDRDHAGKDRFATLIKKDEDD